MTYRGGKSDLFVHGHVNIKWRVSLILQGPVEFGDEFAKLSGLLFRSIPFSI